MELGDALGWAMGIIGFTWVGFSVIVGLIMLSGIIVRKTGDLFDQRKKRRRPVRRWIR